MAQKIILFMSRMKSESDSFRILCPSGEYIEGKQTNEVPALWFLRTYSKVKEILCIVTAEACETAYPYFESRILAEYPNVNIRTIDYDDNQNFEEGPLAALIDSLDKSDEILLDTTGGLRNNIMQLMLIARVLVFRGNKLLDAVYCNVSAEKRKLESVLPLFEHMELISGMQELSDFCSVRLLKDYYKDYQNIKVKQLLEAAERLHNSLAICDTGNIQEYVGAVRDALNDIKQSDSDPLTLALLNIYEDKFVKEFNTPGIIRWCLNNDMLQQALTIYNVWIPEYLLKDRQDLFHIEDSDLFHSRISDNGDSGKQSYKSAYELAFEFYVLNMSVADHFPVCFPRIERYGHSYITTLQNLGRLLGKSYVKKKSLYSNEDIQQIKDIIADYVFIRLLRNRINHSVGNSTPEEKKYLVNKLREIYRNFPELDSLDYYKIKKYLYAALDRLKRTK